MPSTVIIDRKGNLRWLHRGYKARRRERIPGPDPRPGARIGTSTCQGAPACDDPVALLLAGTCRCSRPARPSSPGSSPTSASSLADPIMAIDPRPGVFVVHGPRVRGARRRAGRHRRRRRRLRLLLMRTCVTVAVCLPLLLLLASAASAGAAVLPEDRADIMYHRYDGGGMTVDGPSVLVRKKFGESLVGHRQLLRGHDLQRLDRRGHHARAPTRKSASRRASAWTTCTARPPTPSAT